MRPSPNTQANTERREKDHWYNLFGTGAGGKIGETARKLEKKLEDAKKSKRSLQAEFETAAKVAKQDHEKDAEWHRAY